MIGGDTQQEPIDGARPAFRIPIRAYYAGLAMQSMLSLISVDDFESVAPAALRRRIVDGAVLMADELIARLNHP